MYVVAFDQIVKINKKNPLLIIYIHFAETMTVIC